MNQKTFILRMLLFGIFIFSGLAQQQNFPVLKGPYLGQKPPGKTPEVFAPLIISRDEAVHGQIAFYPNGKEIYWIFHSPDYGKNPPVINFVKEVDGQWAKPGILEFSKEYGVMSISITPDGEKLFFDSNRPWPDSWGMQPSANTLESYKIWYVKRIDSGWGKPKPLEQRINRNIKGVSAAIDGTLYSHGIKRIRFENGQYTEWEQLPHPLNIGRIRGGNPFISPDESYILFNRKWSGRYGYGICISYRTGKNHWTEPVNLLERLNAQRGGSQPVVSPDGRYLFYYAGGKFYWVDAEMIEELKQDILK